MNKLKHLSAGWLAIGTLIVLTGVFFYDVLFLGRNFFAGDNLSINIPSKVLFFRMLRAGQLPLWNPYVFSGSPFLADINLGLLSSFNVFYLLSTPLRALTYSVVSAILFAGISMYVYCRKMRLSSYASLVASAVFMFSGTMMTHILKDSVTRLLRRLKKART